MKLRYRYIVIVLIILAILSACGQKGIKDAKNWPIEDFTFKDQNGQPFGLKDLKGKIWIADFIFTSCPDICPPMTFNMVRLQSMVKEEGIDNVEFVSFSVDPEVDSPEAMKEYGERFKANFENFHFLTGYDQSFIETFALDNFKALVKKSEEEDYVTHQSYFYLVDQEGKIMKYYTGLNDIPFDEIIQDIKSLQ